MSEHFGVDLMRHIGMEPDSWQLEVLDSRHPRLLLLRDVANSNQNFQPITSALRIDSKRASCF